MHAVLYHIRTGTWGLETWKSADPFSLGTSKYLLALHLGGRSRKVASSRTAWATEQDITQPYKNRPVRASAGKGGFAFKFDDLSLLPRTYGGKNSCKLSS